MVFLLQIKRDVNPCRSSYRRFIIKKVVLKNIEKFRERHLCQSLFFNKVAGLWLATLLKKRLWHRCFPVKFAKFLRHLFCRTFANDYFFSFSDDFRDSWPKLTMAILYQHVFSLRALFTPYLFPFILEKLLLVDARLNLKVRKNNMLNWCSGQAWQVSVWCVYSVFEVTFPRLC